MNILVTSLPDLKKINPQRPHHLLKKLSENHDITVLSVNAWWIKESADDFIKKNLKNLEYKYISEKRINPIFQEFLIKKNLKHLDINFNSFEAHINFNSIISGYYISKKTKLPLIFDICDDIIDWISLSPQVPTLLNPLGRKMGNYLLKKNIKQSNKVTVSIDYLNKIYKIPSKKSVIIPNGVDTNIFKYKREKIRKKLNISEKTFILGFVGFLGDWVKLEDVLKVIPELIDEIKLKLIIVGGGNIEKYKIKSTNLGIDDKVIFLGDVPYTDVPKYISEMDVCILPFNTSKVSQGALPLKLFEYMACEKPVISSIFGSIKKIVEERILYYQNILDLKNNIIKLHNNEDLRLQLGKDGRKFVKENYNWNKICQNFEDVLIELTDD